MNTYPTPLPGHSGNLTMDQTLLLAELWSRLLRVLALPSTASKKYPYDNTSASEPSTSFSLSKLFSSSSSVNKPPSPNQTSPKSSYHHLHNNFASIEEWQCILDKLHAVSFRDQELMKATLSQPISDSPHHPSPSNRLSKSHSCNEMPNLNSDQQNPQPHADPKATSFNDMSSLNPDPAQRVIANIEDCSSEELVSEFWSMVQRDHPDQILLRFLRARKWNVEKAFHMLLETLKWRLEWNVCGIVRRGEFALNTNALKPPGKSYFHNHDKENRPICYIHVRYHDKSAISLRENQLLTIWIMETCRALVQDPVETVSVVMDLTDFTMANMDFEYVKFLVSCFQAYYPECLGVCIIYNAPFIFSGCWRIIKPLLDPVVAGKFHFANSTSELEQFIERNQIVSLLGGDDPWEYSYTPPTPDEKLTYKFIDKQEALESQRKAQIAFEKLTLEWCLSFDKPQEDLEKVNQEFEVKRTAARKEVTDTFKKADRYLRQPTIYHRIGAIKLE